MSRFLLTMCLVVILPVSFTACQENLSGSNQPRQEKSGASPVMDAASFVDKVRAMGLLVEPGEEAEQPFFSVTGTMIKIRGEDVQLFQYPSSAAADAQAAAVSPDGSAVGTAKPFWVGPPHFYKSGKLLVLYIGDNAAVRQALEAVLGRQFAGRA